jgi:hypothetical protein
MLSKTPFFAHEPMLHRYARELCMYNASAEKTYKLPIFNVICINPRVARRLLFKPKILFWVNFVGYCDGRCWHILWLFGLSYSHL